jgi:hypothetical protein
MLTPLQRVRVRVFFSFKSYKSMDGILNITLTNNSYCEHVDLAIEQIWDMKNLTLTQAEENISTIVSGAFLLLGLVFCTVGAKIFRFVAGFTLGLVAFYGGYKLSEQSTGISCDSRLIISAFLALIAVLLTTCLISFALFMIGAGSLVFLVHMLFSVFPETETAFDDTQIFGKTLLYWGVVLLSGLIGGCLFKKNKISALETTTSILGGVIFAYGLYGMTKATDTSVDTRLYFGVAIGLASTGFILQRKTRSTSLHSLLCSRRTRKSETSKLENKRQYTYNTNA